MQHVLSARQFEVAELEEIFAHADYMRQAVEDNRRALAATHLGQVVATVFYEASTRTRLSFEAAAVRLGAGVISTENAGEFSSAIKGETIEDSTLTIGRYADAIIMRHPETGAAKRAALVSQVSVLNAGDGKGEHPTQALLDLYTIKREQHRAENLRVVMGGDLAHGRTARSLAQLLALYSGNHITFVSTPELQMGEDITQRLDQQGTTFNRTDDMHEALRGADVVYWTRMQKERWADTSGSPLQRLLRLARQASPKKKLEKVQGDFVIDQAALNVLPEGAMIMHPLPRNDEIHPSIDTDPRAKYFDQVENGMYIRMALLDRILGSVS